MLGIIGIGLIIVFCYTIYCVFKKGKPFKYRLKILAVAFIGLPLLFSGISMIALLNDPERYAKAMDDALTKAKNASTDAEIVNALKNFRKEEKVIDISSNEDTRVQINPGDHMVIGGPWKLEGSVQNEGHLKYRISHEFKGKNGKKSSLYLTGKWDNKPHSIPIDGIESLDEWLVCIWGSHSYEDGKSIFTPNFSEKLNLKTVSDIKALTSH